MSLKKKYSPIKGLGVFKSGYRNFLFYLEKKGGMNIFKVATSTNGYSFIPSSQKPAVLGKGLFKKKVDISKCSDFHVSQTKEGSYFLLYKKQQGGSTNLHGAFSKDLLKWKDAFSFPNLKERGIMVSDFLHDDQYIMFFGEKNIKVAFSYNLKKWNQSRKAILKTRKSGFDNYKIFPAEAFLRPEGIVLLYYAVDKKGNYSLGVALLSKNDPKKILWRSRSPLWKQSKEVETKNKDLTPVGITTVRQRIVSYWQDEAGEFISMFLPQIWFLDKQEKQEAEEAGPEHATPKMKKSKKNPIVEPRSGNKWDCDAAFNPTAMRKNGTTYVLYRAMGTDPVSVLGCAETANGRDVDRIHEDPVYIPRSEFEGAGQAIDPNSAAKYMSGGGCGGCEDARIVELEGKYYLTYVAYDGANPPRVALSSISVEDFHNGNTDNWTKPVLISQPGVVDKNACILPEKVNGKYVIYHRIYPNILVDYVDSLDDFDGESVFLEGEYVIPPRPLMWDSKKVGVGPSPIKTDYGWLAIYQAVGRQEPGRYKIGAMLLDLEDPTKVISRSNEPIVEPVEWYENDGHKAGVVYPCGATVHDNKLFVYYGGADKFTCVATEDFDHFVRQLWNSNRPKLKKAVLT